YANRAMLLAFLCVPIALISVGLAAYVRLQPPTVIRVDQNGEAVVVGQKSTKLTVAQGSSADPADFERAALVKNFLEHYLNFSPDSVNRNWGRAQHDDDQSAPDYLERDGEGQQRRQSARRPDYFRVPFAFHRSGQR